MPGAPPVARSTMLVSALSSCRGAAQMMIAPGSPLSGFYTNPLDTTLAMCRYSFVSRSATSGLTCCAAGPHHASVKSLPDR